MTQTGERADPLLAFRYLVRVGGLPVGGFTEVTGLTAEVDVLDLMEGGENRFVHRLPGRMKHTNLSLKRGLATMELWAWFALLSEGVVRRLPVVVELLSADGGSTVMRWVLRDAFPARWLGPDLKADQSAVAVETIELAHHGFVMGG
jgi:phage tail-like protein